jgi:hypothetical protein
MPHYWDLSLCFQNGRRIDSLVIKARFLSWADGGQNLKGSSTGPPVIRTVLASRHSGAKGIRDFERVFSEASVVVLAGGVRLEPRPDVNVHAVRIRDAISHQPEWIARFPTIANRYRSQPSQNC